MKFYSENRNVIVWNPVTKRGIPFVDGVYETEDAGEIARLKECGYRSDDDAETEQGNPGGQEAKAESTIKELRQQAKEKQMTGYSRMNKEQLLEALKEGD